jgi:hypothetical protein
MHLWPNLFSRDSETLLKPQAIRLFPLQQQDPTRVVIGASTHILLVRLKYHDPNLQVLSHNCVNIVAAAPEYLFYFIFHLFPESSKA